MAEHPPPTPAGSAAPDAPTGPRTWLTPTAAYYPGWACLAWLSHAAGHTTLGPASAALLAGAILITNLLLTLLDLPSSRDAAAAAAAARAGLAIAWTTVYAVMAQGAGELVPAMYLTAVLLAVNRTTAQRLRQLALAAAGACAAAVAVRLLAAGPGPAAWGWILQCIGLTAMLVVLDRRAHQSEAGQRALTRQVSRLQHEVVRISRRAERDHLTKSYNRQYIMEALVREKARADRTGIVFSVCIFDLDQFKSLNDTHGHLVGDHVLVAFATRARQELRSMDAINPTRFRRALGRLGGEEFIAVLPGTRIDGALRCAERVRAAVARDPVDRDLAITVSAGVAEYRCGESIPELLTRADRAMYAAKRSGRNRVRVGVTRAPDEPRPRPRLRIIR
jgi:diguanylate cyclase (GGDEF)-like protein